MNASPRILDLAGRTRTTTVEVTGSPLTELLVGLQTFQFEEAAPTFDVGPGWFDHVRTRVSQDVAAALSEVGPLGWGTLLAKALVERWPDDVPAFIDRVDAMDAEALWLLFGGACLPPFAEHHSPETFRRAARGEAAARAELANAARAMFGDKESEGGVWTLGAREMHALVGVILRGWYRDVARTELDEVLPILQRDAAAKQRLGRSATDEQLIEQATNGIVYVPEAWVHRVVLTPHLAMRPWNVTCAFEGTYVICYPVADESMGIDRSAPPARLTRLHKALADDKRLRILKLLAGGDRTLQEVADAVGLAKSTAHHHTVVLRSAGLIRTSTELDGHYSLRRDSLAEAGFGLVDFLEGGSS